MASAQSPFHWILLVSATLVILFSFYKFIYAKNYDFLVEAPCDPATDECYVRDCSGGDCPPNNLSTYHLYRIPAANFSSCSDNSCSNICAQESGACAPVPCSSQTEVECSGPAASQ